MNTEAHLVNQDAGKEREEALLERVVQTLSKSENQFSIERLKALGAMTLEGTMNPADVERRVNLVEKCFSVMERLEDKKVKLACCKTVSRILCGKSRRSRICLGQISKMISRKVLPSFVCRCKEEGILEFKNKVIWLSRSMKRNLESSGSTRYPL